MKLSKDRLKEIILEEWEVHFEPIAAAAAGEPAWTVSEDDRKVMHVITKSELGEEDVDYYRNKALKAVKRYRKKLKEDVIKEEFSDDEYRELTDIIRMELAQVMYDLFKRRSFWVNRG